VNTRLPRIRFAPDLVEAVVEVRLRGSDPEGGRGPLARYRRETDRIYTLYDRAEERRGAFQALHTRLFEALRCGEAVVEEAQALAGRSDGILVGRAWTRAEEGAELSADRRMVGLRVLPERFSSPEGLRTFLRHEFGHAFDMLDDAFGYGAGAPSAPGALPRVTGERFGVLWDCVVDGRTERTGGVPLHRREDLVEACARLYPALPRAAVTAVVARLWAGERPTYTALLAWATDPGVLAASVGASPESAGAVEVPPPPGASCPLCGFPTHAWAHPVDAAVARRIQEDVPRWVPALGVCARCVEAYAVTASAGGAA